MSRPKASAGFTLIELMITVAILAVFAAVALPSFSKSITNSRVQASSNELASLIQYARSTAAQNNQSMDLCVSSGVWTVRKATSPVCDSSATILRSFTPASGVSVSASVTSLTFRSNGTASASANLITCYGSTASTGYKLAVQASGFVRAYAQGKDGSSNLTSCTAS